MTNDSIIFTIVQSKNISYNRSVGIKELSDNSLVFEGYDSQRISSGIIYNGVYRGTREKNVDEKTAVKYRKDIIGDWKVTYDLYGTMTSTLRINDNGTFVFYDEKPSDGYNGTYSDEFKEYAKQVVKNAKAFSKSIYDRIGWKKDFNFSFRRMLMGEVLKVHSEYIFSLMKYWT